MVAARVRERPTGFRAEVKLGRREARKQWEMEVLREIVTTVSDTEEQMRLFRERTQKKGRATFYRRMTDLEGVLGR